MACPGGCVAGAGTLQNPVKSTAALNKYKASAPEKYSVDSKYEITLNLFARLTAAHSRYSRARLSAGACCYLSPGPVRQAYGPSVTNCLL